MTAAVGNCDASQIQAVLLSSNGNKRSIEAGLYGERTGLHCSPEAEVAGSSPAGCAKLEQSFSGIVPLVESVGTVAVAKIQAVSARLDLSSTRAHGVTGRPCRWVILAG